MLCAIVLFILGLLWFYDGNPLGVNKGMYDTRKSKKFFLRWYDRVSDEEGIAWVLRGEVEVWPFVLAGAKTPHRSGRTTACHNTGPVGVDSVPEFDNFAEEDGDLPTYMN